MKRRHKLDPVFICLLTLLTVFISGCGKQKNEAMVTGTVTLNGEPVADGRIQFEDSLGEASSAGGKIQGGHYELVSPPAAMRVRIVAYREVPGKFLEMNPGVKTPFIEQYIPAKYNESTELTADLVVGKNSKDFELVGTVPASK